MTALSNFLLFIFCCRKGYAFTVIRLGTINIIFAYIKILQFVISFSMKSLSLSHLYINLKYVFRIWGLDQYFQCKFAIYVYILHVPKLIMQLNIRVFQHLFPPPHNILALPSQIYLSQVKIDVF